MKKLAIIAIAAVAGVSSAAIYENAAVTNGTNGGNPISQFSAPYSTFGFGAQITAGNSMADNFTVTGAGWNISRIAVYSYQTGNSSTNFTFTGINLSIVTGSDPNAGSVVLNLTNAAVANDGFVGYRVADTGPTATNRAIFRVGVASAAVNLAPGNYMLRWSLAGSLASGPWAPPAPGIVGNGFQSIAAAPYAAAIDAGSGERAELPFQITYTAVPEPATMLALGAGLAAIAARRRRK